MSGLRAGLGLPGAAADVIVRAARLADEWNIDSLWIGDPAGTAPNADDTYVMVAAAAAAAATTHVRLGVFLSARSSSPPLRIAEDIGVVDQIAAGRLAVAFGPPPTDSAGGDAAWRGDLERIATAPQGWDLGDGRRMPVTPAPAQPAVPIAVFSRPGDGIPPTEVASDRSGDGVPPTEVASDRSGDDGPPVPAASLPLPAPFVARPRPAAPSPVLLAFAWPDATAPPTADELLRWKAAGAEAGATEVILLADPAVPLDIVAAVFGTVVAPCLRAADHEVGILTLDATRWLEQCGGLHHRPD